MKIFATQALPGDYLADLGREHELVVWPNKNISRSELLEQVRGADVIISLLTEQIDAEVIEAAGGQLKIIANYAVGYDNIDIEEATGRGIVVLNTPGVMAEAVGEHVIALSLALLRRIVEGDRYIRSGKFKGWEPDVLVGSAIRGRTMGIIGMGRIGGWTAKLAKGLGMKVIYYSRSPDAEAEAETGAEYKTMDELLSEADVVSLNVPLTDETKGMIGASQLGQMKKTAILINTARGAVVIEADLIKALRDKTIAGAGLDVFETETKINPQLFDLDNVVLTPHIASATHESREAMAKLVSQGIASTLKGQKPENIVNPEVWEKRRP
jgi:glyoxylate reductase